MSVSTREKGKNLNRVAALSGNGYRGFAVESISQVNSSFTRPQAAIYNATPANQGVADLGGWTEPPAAWNRRKDVEQGGPWANSGKSNDTNYFSQQKGS
jgi:hypothetical protein